MTSSRFAIVISRYYAEISEGLLLGATQYLKEKDIPWDESDLFVAPGAFEIPLIAQKLAQSGKYSGVICLGCVIEGDTAHFHWICAGVSQGLMHGMLTTGIPISFGILTTQTEDQAIERSQKNSSNKGRESAAACVLAAQELTRVSRPQG